MPCPPSNQQEALTQDAMPVPSSLALVIEERSSSSIGAGQTQKDSSSRPALLTMTQDAIDRVHVLIAQRGKPSLGIRIGVKKGGCSGLTYTMEYVDQAHGLDEKVAVPPSQDAAATTIFIDPKAVLYLIGTEMDYVEEPLKSGFVFRNPNEKGRCGCGESFHV
jgi:iron-sulfur cluster assembly protein